MLGISDTFPVESMKFIRLSAPFTFQTIPAFVAEDLMNPPSPSMVRTTSLSVGLFANTYLMPCCPKTWEAEIPLPSAISFIALLIALDSGGAMSGSPSNASCPRAKKYCSELIPSLFT